MDNELPVAVHNLIQQHINSVVQLEILLMLRREPRVWSPEEVAEELRIDNEAAAQQLRQLAGSGLLNLEEAPALRCTYQPPTAQLAEAVDGLAAAYDDRRVTQISLIYSKSSEKIRVFADAFRFRKDDKDG